MLPASSDSSLNERTAYVEFQDIIRACLAVDFFVRPPAYQIQEQLYAILHKRGWSINLLVPERTVLPYLWD